MRVRRYGFQPGWWRRYLPFAGGFGIVATVLIASYLNNRVPIVPARRLVDQEAISRINSNATRTQWREIKKSYAAEKNLSPVEKFVRMESLKVGQADPDPSKTHARLRAVARGLGKKDLDTLQRSAMNTSLGNDRRFLSVYLLALSENAQSAPALLGIALAPMTIQDSTSVHYAEELMIRTQALEGMARQNPETLKKFLANQDNSFLAEQARRLLREKKQSARN